MKISDVQRPPDLVLTQMMADSGVSKYTVAPTGAIEVIGLLEVEREFPQLPSPYHLNMVKGGLRMIKMVSLVGAPKYVGGLCEIIDSDITNVAGAPLQVDGFFAIERCKNLTSLVGSPQTVSGDFFLSGCDNLQSLVGSPRIVKGDVKIYDLPITSLAGLPTNMNGGVIELHLPHLNAILPILKVKNMGFVITQSAQLDEIITRHYKEDGTGDIIALQDDLIEAGFANVARMR